MKNKKIIIADGSGFIGQEMIKYFGKENEVVILTRQVRNARNNRNTYNSLKEEHIVNTRFVKWNGKTIGEWQTNLKILILLSIFLESQ